MQVSLMRFQKTNRRQCGGVTLYFAATAFGLHERIFWLPLLCTCTVLGSHFTLWVYIYAVLVYTVHWFMSSGACIAVSTRFNTVFVSLVLQNV